jgi:hypothetical protein
MAIIPPVSRTAIRLLAGRAPGGPGAGLRRAALVALMPWALRRSHVVELLDQLDGQPSRAVGTDARKVMTALRRRRTTCLYRSLAGFGALRGAGEPVSFVIGVRVDSGEVVAHAWIEERGEPVGEPVDPRERFSVAFTYPPRQASGGGNETGTRMAKSLSSRDVILTEMKDGTGVLLDLRSKFYFTLNATGVAVWKLLAAGEAATARTIAERIAREFDAPSVEAVEADVAALLAELSAEGLLAEDVAR